MADNKINPYEIIRGRYDNCVEVNKECKLFNKNKHPDKSIIEDIKNNKIAIYTAFTGDYDTLKDPKIIDENCDYICFTDNPNLESDVWEIRQMDDCRLDNNLKAKRYKVFPNKYLPEYKYSFWLDGSFRIVGSIREFIYNFINSSMLNVIHPERNCIFDEADSSVFFTRYSKHAIFKQVESYSNEGMPSNYGLPALGAIFRKHNDSTIVDLMNQWWNEIINFTNQDQLSFTYLMWKNNFHPSVAPVYCWINDYWTMEGQYHHKHEINNYVTSWNLINSLKDNIQDKNLLTKEELLLMFNDIDSLQADAEELNDERNFWDNKINDIKDSASWKLTKGLRKLRNGGKNGEKSD